MELDRAIVEAQKKKSAKRAKLSQRVARASTAPAITELPLATKLDFLARVERAESFEKLPKRWKDIIIAAEKEMKDGVILFRGERVRRKDVIP